MQRTSPGDVDQADSSHTAWSMAALMC
jgi:hypothetical protein